MKYLDIWINRIQENNTSNYYSLLSTEEKNRAEKHKNERAKVRFIQGRGVLRILLGKRLQCPPEQVEIAYTAFLKPTLPDKEVKFNVSHSGNYLAIAITDGEEVGVDIEQHRPLENLKGIADQIFNAEEHALFSRCPKHLILSCFYDFWTQKEACLKALGKGFLTNPKTVSILNTRLNIKNFSVLGGYSAAVAMRGPLPTERVFFNRW